MSGGYIHKELELNRTRSSTEFKTDFEPQFNNWSWQICYKEDSAWFRLNKSISYAPLEIKTPWYTIGPNCVH